MNAPFPLTGANSATFSRWELSGARTLTLLQQKAPPELRNPGGSPSTSPCHGSGADTTRHVTGDPGDTRQPPRSRRGDRLPSSWTLSTAPRSSGLSSCSSHHRKSPPRAGGAMTGTSTTGSRARKPTRTATHPYPSFCFSSLLMGAALAVHTDVANTRQREAVAATRLHGAR